MTDEMSRNQCRSNCPINLALELFGDKWSLLIIRDMVFMKKKHYGDFLAAPEKISTNILADRLEKLERAQIISKHADEEHGSKYIYRLEQKGRDLLPMLIEMMRWSFKHAPEQGAPPEMQELFEGDRDKLVKYLLAEMDAKSE